MATRHDILEVIAYSPVAVLTSFGLGLILSEIIPAVIGPGRILDYIGIGLLCLGTALLMYSESYRREFFHPETDATCYEFNRGPYRFSRHPGYVAYLMLYIGFALILNSLAAIMVVVPLFVALTFIIIPMEEKLLRQACEGAYDEYKAHVRMWL